jgi:hypothetical protein
MIPRAYNADEGHRSGPGGIPGAFKSPAAYKMARMIRCPDLLDGFLIACCADMLSQRIVARFSQVVAAPWLPQATLINKLMASLIVRGLNRRRVPEPDRLV